MQFHDLYVISDLHMGGPPGFQIFKNGARLGRLLTQLAAGDPTREIGLVINGDLIDSLAEDYRDGYISVGMAQSMLDRIYADPAFEPVWNGLAAFVQNARRYLIITLGNHDLELALPPVEASIRRRLAGNDTAASGRIHFATHGTGYACQVGKARVFCTHGNEVDDWNVVDHDALRKLAEAINAGRAFDRSAWLPNAGTRFVVDVMNQIKRRNPFVDLLKPEGNSVFPVLLTLDPECVRGAAKGWPLLADRVRGGLIRMGFLSADSEKLEYAHGDSAANLAADFLLGPSLKEELEQHGGPRAKTTKVDDLLLDAGERVRLGKDPLDGSPSDALTGQLGWFGLVIDLVRRVDRSEALRRALIDWLKGDESFHLANRDETFRLVTERVGPEIDFVVTGHTHLERAIRIEKHVDRFYFNSGTWVRMIQLSQNLLTPQSFETLWTALNARSMHALDSAEVEGRPLIADRATVVHISAPDPTGPVTGQLLHASGGGADAVRLEPVPGSQFTKS